MSGVPLTAPPSAADRLASALGWTPGQVWTVALGLALAIPAGVFGLGPALDSVASTASTIAAPAPVAAPEVATSSSPAGTAPGTAPDAPPLRTPPGRTTAASSGAPASAPVAAEAGPVGGSTPPPVIAGVGGSVTIPGPGEARAVAAAADAVVVAVDRGAGAPGAVVVVDDDGAVTAAVDLVADGIPHHGARGVAVDDRGVLVTTASPAALLRVDPVAGTVEAVATIPDLPVCVPVARETGCQPGAVDAVPEPGHLTVGPDGTAYVVDRAQACVFRIDGDTAAPWLCDLEYTPSPADADSGLRGIAAADDAVVLTARLAIGGRNVVHHVAVEDGEAGARRQVADLEPAEEIGGATMLGGRIAVTLAAPGVVLVISPDDPGSDQRLSGFTRPADIDVRADELFVVEPAPGGAGSLRTRDAPAG